MNKNKETRVVSWGYDLIRNIFLNHREDYDFQEDLYRNYLSPFMKDIFGTHTPVYIFGGQEIKLIVEKNMLTFRDGLLPLTIFFKEANVDQFAPIIAIHKDYHFIVPDEWKKKVIYYDINSKRKYSKNSLPKKILITGMMNSALSEPREFEKSLENLAQKVGVNNLEKIEISCFCPSKRNDLWGGWEEENVLRYSQAIFQKLKLDIKVPEWKHIIQESDYTDTLYYEINNGFFIKDSFPLHHILAKGAGLLADDESLTSSQFKIKNEIALSLYHSIRFYDCDYSTNDPFETQVEDLEYFKQISAIESKNKKLNFRWEEWYASYIKKYYSAAIEK